MNRIRIAIGDKDHEYLQLVTDYLRHSTEKKKFRLYTFTEPAYLHRYLEEEPPHILLLHPEFVPPESLLRNHQEMIILQEDEHHPHPQLKTIQKYQALHQLFYRLEKIYTQNYGTREIDQGYSKLISIFSASGGSGKTTISYTVARKLATLQHSVLYLSFEAVQSLFTGNETEDAFGRILYYLKKGDENITDHVRSILRHDSETNLHYFPPLLHPQDINEITEEETIRLIQAIHEMKKFDYIVIDLESTLQERVKAVFNQSHYIYWIITDDVIALRKNEQMRKVFSRLSDLDDRVMFILNKYVGTKMNSFESFGFHISYTLPYIPVWKNLTNVEAWENELIFTLEIEQMLSSVVNDMNEVYQR